MRPTDIAAMRRAMAREAEVMNLILNHGMSYGQIKARTGLSRNAVAGLVYRHKKRDGQEVPCRAAPEDRLTAPITPALLRLAEFDPLARRLVEERTAHAPHS